MSQASSTEPLARMLRSIALQKRTGLLAIEQWGEEGGEQGVIYFEAGYPVRVQAGQISGRAALQRISSWKQITCSFHSTSRPYPGNLPALTASGEQSEKPGPSVHPPHSSSPQTETLFRAPFPASFSKERDTDVQRVPGPITPLPHTLSPSASLTPKSPNVLLSQTPATQSFSPHRDTSEAPRPSAPRPNQRWVTRLLVQTPPRLPVSVERLPTTPHSMPRPVGGPLPGQQAIFQSRSVAATRQAMRVMERYDRVIFILLNGNRTVEDIVRLTHYTTVEVEQVLMRLHRLGYIERVAGPRPLPTVRETLANLFTSPLQEDQVPPVGE